MYWNYREKVRIIETFSSVLCRLNEAVLISERPLSEISLYVCMYVCMYIFQRLHCDMQVSNLRWGPATF